MISSFVYRRYPHRVKSALQYVTVFSNCGFMGFPVLQSIYGSIGVFYGSMYNIPFSVLTPLYGILVFSGKSDREGIKKILVHPVILSVAVGMALFLFRLKLPAPLYNAASMVGSMTSPLSMLIVVRCLPICPLRKCSEVSRYISAVCASDCHAFAVLSDIEAIFHSGRYFEHIGDTDCYAGCCQYRDIR